MILTGVFKSIWVILSPIIWDNNIICWMFWTGLFITYYGDLKMTFKKLKTMKRLIILIAVVLTTLSCSKEDIKPSENYKKVLEYPKEGIKDSKIAKY